MKKHLLSILLALISVLSVSSITVLATEPEIKNHTYYDDGEAFSEGMAVAVKNGKYGFIAHDYVNDFCNGYAATSTALINGSINGAKDDLTAYIINSGTALPVQSAYTHPTAILMNKTNIVYNSN